MPGPKTLGVLAAALALVVYCLARYRDALLVFFFLDDFWLMHSAAQIRAESLADLAAIFRPTHAGFNLYRPLTQVGYYYLLRQLFAYDSSGYHAMQILVYALNTVLVFAIARRLTESTVAAFAAGLLYATAPGHATTVYWVAAFTMSGTALAVFALLWCWLYTRSVWRVILCTVLQAIALLASEHAVAGPFLLAILAMLAPRREPGRQLAAALLPAFVLVAVYLASKLWYFKRVQAPWGPYAMSLDLLGWLERIGRYAAACFNVLTLPGPGPPSWRGIGAAVVGALLFALWRSRRAGGPWRLVAGGGAMFLIGLLPVLPLRDHVYTYFVAVAALGIVLAVLGLCQLTGRHWRWVALAAALAVVTVDLETHQKAARGDEIVQLTFRGSEAAANWVLGVQRAVARNAPVVGAFLPRDSTTEWVFAVGQIQTYFPSMPTRVNLYDPGRRPPASLLRPDQIVVPIPANRLPGEPLPGWEERWNWLRALADGGVGPLPQSAQPAMP